MGSWDALYEVAEKDEKGNRFEGPIVAEESEGCLAWSEKALVALIGVKDLRVAASRDAVLVLGKGFGQKVKNVVERLERDPQFQKLVKFPLEENRPWGKFIELERGPRYRIKRLVVNPGAGLSKQLHYHRSEHWIVVKGTAKVRLGEKVFYLRENESTFVPPATVHRLENPGKIPLEIIEIQVGSYLEEDDIVRLEDRYGRS